MQDHFQTAIQAIKHHLGKLLNPKNYRVNHRLKTVNGLESIASNYDLIILDRDCTLQPYHSSERVPEFESTLQSLVGKSELVSNSSYNEFLRICEIYGNLMPINKLVKFAGEEDPYLLRYENGRLKAYKYSPTDHKLIDATSETIGEDNALKREISYNYKKPDPLVIQAVIDYKKKSLGKKPNTLMVGDRYLTDIAAGNLAGIDTAKVKAYKPFSDKISLVLTRYLLDYPLGGFMSRISRLIS